MGVFATDLTRESLWEAFCARRVFAATGDQIDARLLVDDAWMGAAIDGNSRRELAVEVDAAHEIDRVELFKNDRLIRRLYPTDAAATDAATVKGPYRLQITWGWGKNTEPVAWDCQLELSAGEITQWQSCFSGQAIVSPDGDAAAVGPDSVDLPHQLLATDRQSGHWTSVTMGNRTMRHETTQGLKLTIDAPLTAKLKVVANGQVIEHHLGDLLFRSRSTFLRGWLTEAIRIGSLVPESVCRVSERWIDRGSEPVDRYRIQVAQKNGQWAWSSPIWVTQH